MSTEGNKKKSGNGLYTRFSSTNQPANRGRKKKPRLKDIPPDARERVYSALFHALSLPDQRTAAEYLNKVAEELPEFGYLIQIYAKGMMGKQGILYASDLLDRLFGKPRQAQDIDIAVNNGTPPVIVFGTPESQEPEETKEEQQ